MSDAVWTVFYFGVFVGFAHGWTICGYIMLLLWRKERKQRAQGDSVQTVSCPKCFTEVLVANTEKADRKAIECHNCGHSIEVGVAILTYEPEE